MKKTLRVNVGRVAFTMDEDAYLLLKRYLDDIALRCEPGDEETLQDVEMRVADLFMEQLRPATSVVDVALVRRVMAIIGRAECFGEPVRKPEEGRKTRRLYRSRYDRVLAGLCGGVAQYFGIDATLVRVLTFLLIFFGGISVWIYIILWIAIPLQPEAGREWDDFKTR